MVQNEKMNRVRHVTVVARVFSRTRYVCVYVVISWFFSLTLRDDDDVYMGVDRVKRITIR